MRARERATGALAVLVLAGILIGLPMLLSAVGTPPVPAAWPTWEQVTTALTTPDDGTLALTAITLLAWVVWAALAVTIVLEVLAQLRGRPVPTLPGLALPQTTAHALVCAALALFIATPATFTAVPAGGTPTATYRPVEVTGTAATLSAATAQHTGPTPASPTPANPTPASPTPAGPTIVAPPATGPAAPAPVETGSYTVQPGDTLWSIAQTHLGSGHDYHRILALNTGVLGGRADWITPGTLLRLPDTTQPAAPSTSSVAGESHIVTQGDTLSGLAQQHLGDGARWPVIYQASTGITQPDGSRLTDPDLIHPGWQVIIPGSGATPVTPSRPNPGEPAAPDPQGTAEPSTETVDTAAAAAALDTAQDLGTPDRDQAPPEPARQDPPSQVDRVPPAAPQEQLEETGPAQEQDPLDADWVLAGLVGSGALLGGAMFLTLSARRAARSRHRRPGRAIAPPGPGLAPVEKTVQTAGARAAPTLAHLDGVLRALGATCSREGFPVPALVAAQLTDTHLTLHLAVAADLPGPWVGSTDRLHWTLPTGTDADLVGPEDPVPYPLLVSIGTGDDGSTWLLNLEDREVGITGHPDYAHDLARYIAAEIAVNPWSAGVALDCVGVAEEVAPMNPARVRAGHDVAGAHLVAHVTGVIDRLDGGLDVPTARVTQTGEDTWPARVLLIDTARADDTTGRLRDLIAQHPGKTGAALVVLGDHPGDRALVLDLTGHGRLVMPGSGLDLVAAGLTADEAHGCAALLAQNEQAPDVNVPTPSGAEGEQGWRAWADEAGALREEHTLPRHATPGDDADDTHTVLGHPDEDYLVAAATTVADLAALAPHVPAHVQTQAAGADPTLGHDLAAWWDPDSPLPRLTLLGPVGARTRGKALVDRKPYFTELLAYLALRPHGATCEETAEAFTLTTAKCRDYLAKCRDWLGTNPQTGGPHLPHAQKAPAARARGVGVYQVQGVLVDADLFRRLRVRGQARGGAEGIEDLRQALRLVQGRPFTQLRPGGWAWLFDGDRLDQHLVCAIVDVAHIVATHDLQTGNTTGARLAAETAALAAPHEEIPTLDLAAVASAEGHHGQAARLLTDQVCNRTDDQDSVPGDLPDRTVDILTRRGWLVRREAG